jgi:small subunit ribosomal protein S16
MAVKIKLRRMGTIRKPFYRLVVIDSRTSPKGAYIENIGYYQPLRKPAVEKINTERALYWLKKGAKPTEAVLGILKHCGVMKELQNK